MTKLSSLVLLLLASGSLHKADAGRLSIAEYNKNSGADLGVDEGLSTLVAQGFQEEVSKQVDRLCKKVEEQAKIWMEQLKLKRLQDLTAKCGRITGFCGIGCGDGAGDCYNAQCVCPENTCNVKQKCMPEDAVEQGLQDGSIDIDDLAPDNIVLKAGHAASGIASAVKYSVADKALQAVVSLAENPAFKKEVQDMATAAKDQVCMSLRFYVEGAVEIDVNAWVGSLKQGLMRGTSEASSMVEAALKVIFSPVGLVPEIGHTLQTMLDAVAKYSAEYLERHMIHWFAIAVDSMLQELFKRAGTTYEGAMKMLNTIFECATSSTIGIEEYIQNSLKLLQP